MTTPRKGQVTKELIRTFPALRVLQNKQKLNFSEGAKLGGTLNVHLAYVHFDF